MSNPLALKLLDWYQHNNRSLPWREEPTPYRIWVSEVMLQQTRAETVIPYFERWMVRFPTLEALASASQQEVLSEWEGLGYYSRARNLHQAAQKVVEEFEGNLPRDIEQLKSLPGIGRYTAGAITSIAFGQDEPALDGNIRRVLARVFDVNLPARSPAGEKSLWELARAHIPPGQAGDFNQVLMDLGALICTPRRPRCTHCPIIESCKAFSLGIQEERPVTIKKQPVPHYDVSSAVIQQGGQVLIAQRPAHGLLGGMWEYPGGKIEPGENQEAALEREIREELGVEIQINSPFGVYQHAYTHFRVTLYAFLCSLNGDQPTPNYHTQLDWVEIESLEDYPMGKIDRQISAALLKSLEGFTCHS